MVQFVGLGKIDDEVLNGYNISEKVADVLDEEIASGDSEHTLIKQQVLFKIIRDLDLSGDDEEDEGPDAEGIIQEIKDLIDGAHIMIDLET